MSIPPVAPEIEVFRWTKTRARLEALLAERPLTVDARGRRFVALDEDGAPALVFEPPPLFPLPPSTTSVTEWLAALPESPGRHALLLVQAGATALGLWEGDVLIRHKVIRRYVVRGKGRAQPLHLKTRGKSRYGSRLRLQNAKDQLVLTNERLVEWWEEVGPPRTVFVSCPVRTWPELFDVKPKPPFDQRSALLERIRFNVRLPTFPELERVHARLARGRVLRRAGSAPSPAAGGTPPPTVED